MNTSTKGLDLIKQFEGCELTAYVCPAGVLTIGYGHTGSDVFAGQHISQSDADELLVKDLDRFERCVNKYVNVDVKQCQFDALVSFTYNCGEGAFRDSTLLRLLNTGDYEGAAGQFGRWVNGSNGPLAGLVRRREAEEALFRRDGWPAQNGESEEEAKVPKVIATIVAKQDTVLKKEPVDSSTLAADEKVSVAKDKSYQLVWHGKEGDNHMKVSLAYGGGNWFVYLPHWKGLKEEKVPAVGGAKKLDTPYFSQRDNYRDASRTCFSSSCAMLVETLHPGTLPGPRGDDKYVERVFTYGDTTDAYTQLKALASFGVDAKFVQNANVDTVKKQIDRGVPVPIGILHHGPASAPSGGGHWLCVIGYDSKGFIVCDPWGEIDHASGTYVSTDGDTRHYSYNLINARWTVAHDSDGWAIIA
jgi:GH24 family phage-related lysozyme (muramidase)